MKQFGVIGLNLNHSFSKKYFEKKFEKEKIIDAKFELYELQCVENIKTLISNNQNIQGLSVTIPFKETVIPYLNKIDNLVTKIGACNSIHIKNNELIGYNTDVYGFKNSICKHLNKNHKSAIILGNGGAAKAVVEAFKELDISTIVIARNPKNNNEIEWKEINNELFNENQIIVNTTPVGTFPNINEMPNINANFFNKNHLVFDLIYNPTKTKLLIEAEKRNAKIINGLEMLEKQAEESWRIWNR